MPKVSKAHVEARRMQILGAFCSCLAEKGFHQTTIRDICREAGLSTGAVYGQFASKDEMLEALAELGRSSTRGLFEEARTDQGAVHSLIGMVNAAIEHLESEAGPTSARLDLRLWGEGLHTPSIHTLFTEAFESSTAPFVEIVHDGQERLEIDESFDAEAVATTLTALCLGFTALKALRADTSLRPCAEVVARLFSEGLGKGGGQ